MMADDVWFIDTQAALEQYCAQLAKADAIALDTEFLRMYTFYAKPGLFQVNDGQQIALIDPLAIKNWQPFCAILTDAAITKVLHACDEDIELLYHFLGIEPQSVFDTQFAAALCGYDFSLSYQAIVKLFLDVDIDKGHSRSDWLQRPLTQDQLHYAADDVRYLLPIYRQLQEKLLQQQKRFMVDEQYQEVLANFTENDYSDAVNRVKDGWRLDALQFARLKQLAIWREQMMRSKNLPRNRIATNEALMQLAKQSSWNQYQLFNVEGLPPATVKSEGEAILALLTQVNSRNDYRECMAKPASDKLSAQIKQHIKQVAQQAGIHESLLGRKNFTQNLYQQLQAGGTTLPDAIKGWRRPFYQQVLENIVYDAQQEVEA